eukprot:3855833-Rhodomonas_salina.2
MVRQWREAGGVLQAPWRSAILLRAPYALSGEEEGEEEEESLGLFLTECDGQSCNIRAVFRGFIHGPSDPSLLRYAMSATFLCHCRYRPTPHTYARSCNIRAVSAALSTVSPYAPATPSPLPPYAIPATSLRATACPARLRLTLLLLPPL